MEKSDRVTSEALFTNAAVKTELRPDFQLIKNVPYKHRPVSVYIVSVLDKLVASQSQHSALELQYLIEWIISTVKPLIQGTWVGDKIADHSYVIGASPVGVAPTTSSFST